MAILKDDRQFMIVDTLRHSDFETSRGHLKVSDNGYMTTRDPDLAAEIKEKYAGALVTEHGGLHGGARTRMMITVPELPWKKEGEGGSG